MAEEGTQPLNVPASAGGTPASPAAPADPAEQAAFDAAAEAALAHVRTDPSPYGAPYTKKKLDFTVLGVERARGYIRVRIAYKPSGRWSGKAGEEWVFVDSDGNVALRDQMRRPQESMPWVLMGLAVASVIAAAIFIPSMISYANSTGDPLYRAGTSLWLRAQHPIVTDEIQYTGMSVEGELVNWRIAGPGDGQRLMVVPVTLYNQISQQVSVTVNENAAELQDTEGRRYRPINVVDRSVPMDTAIDPRYRIADFIGIWRSFNMRAGESIYGMLVFEVPAGAEASVLTWNASDTIRVRFR